MRDNPLLCVVTGMERSGTTLLSQLLNAHPLVASGFECGLLLRDPAEFALAQPWWDWLADPRLGWALDQSTRNQLISAADHAAAYRLLGSAKGMGIVDPKARDIFQTSPLMIDKTPAYVRQLSTIMQRTDRPFLVTWKTPEDAWESYRKRGVPIAGFLNTYRRSVAGLGRALMRFPDRITLISYRSLVVDTANVMARVAKVLGLPEPHDLTLERYRTRFAGMIEDEDKRRASGLMTNSGFVSETLHYTEVSVELDEVSELTWLIYLADVADELAMIQEHMI
jgi:hypothetical protein